MQRHRSFLRRFMPYGAPDLLDAAPSHLAGGVTMGSALWVALFFTALAVVPQLSRTVVIPDDAIELLPDLPPAPPILPPVATRPTTPIAASARAEAIVVPVLGPEAAPEAAVEAPPSTSEGSDTAIDGGITLAPPRTVGTIAIDEDPPPDRYVPRDVEAEPVIQIKPDYPELARSAQVEGTVRLRALVGTDGRVRRVIVDRSVPLLDQAACEALKRWVFTPALDHGRPVAIWVAVPFRFSLH